MTLKIVVLMVGALAATAASAQQSPMFGKAKALIAERMVDPSSLQYRKLRVVQETVQGKRLTVACGEFNSKNKLGGYTGFRTFAYETTTVKGVIAFDGGKFDLFTFDGADLNSPGAFGETNARVLAVCLGMVQ
jgi:hypothetical protein